MKKNADSVLDYQVALLVSYCIFTSLLLTTICIIGQFINLGACIGAAVKACLPAPLLNAGIPGVILKLYLTYT